MAAKEVDLKKVELKVSVNCCDGCKRKVKKLLQSIEGVLKTEVDSSLPKVTVLGNVEAKVLIKKLAKAGKQAQVWVTAADDQSKPEKGKKEDENWEKKYSREQASCTKSSSCSISVKKIVNTDYGDNISNKKKAENASDGNCSPKPGVTETDNSPAVPHHHLIQTESSTCLVHEEPHAGNIIPYPQYCYNIVERPKVPLSHCAVASLVAPPLCYYGQEPQFYGNPIANQPPVSRVGDYFSDENTMGCHVM